MLDVVALLAAIPATVTAKAVSGKNLFSDATANAVLAAKTWNGMIDALSTPAAAGLPGPSTQADAALDSAANCVLAGKVMAGFSVVMYSIGAGWPQMAPVTGRLKALTDFAGFVCSLANNALVAKVRPPTTLRDQLDLQLTKGQLIPRGRDFFEYVYPLRYGPLPPFEANFLITLECVYGALSLIGVYVSMSWEWKEPAPDGLDLETWHEMIQLKFIERAMNAVDCGLAFEQMLLFGPVKESFVFMRACVQWIEFGSGTALAVLDMQNDQSDFNS